MPDPRFAALAEIAEPLAGWFVEAGHRIYAVGGIVRDRLLGLPLGDDVDLDLTTDATPAQTRAIVSGRVDALWTQGERFGTIGVHHRGRICEITTHRAEVYEPGSRKPVVAYSTDLEADLSRRDFTINAMAVALPELTLVDPFGGEGDLRALRLRTPLTPEVSFADDPLRMLRAARFLATFGLDADPGVVDAATALAHRLEIVAIERIMVELLRLLDLPDPLPGLAFGERTGVLSLVAPEAFPMVDRVARAIERTPPDHRVRLAVLLAGVDPAAASARLGALRLSNADRAAVSRLARLAGAAPSADPAAVRRFVVAAGDDLDRSLAVVAALEPGRGAALREAVTALAEAGDLQDLSPPLDGDEVMAVLGIEQGPDVGRAMGELRRLRVDEGVTDPVVAAERLRTWWDAGGR